MPEPEITRTLGALAVFIDFTGVPVDEWHEWYDTEHRPERAALEGFLTATWWRASDRPNASLGLYDLSGTDVLESPGYLALRDANESAWTTRVHRLRNADERPSHRHLCHQIAPGGALTREASTHLYVWRVEVAAGDENRFERWLASARADLSDLPGVLQIRTFVTENHDDRLHRHLVVIELDRAPGDAFAAHLASCPVRPQAQEIGSFVRPDEMKDRTS